MNESDRNQLVAISAAAVATTSTAATNDPQGKPPPYLKLIADCWEHIFDYLSLADILLMGETCRRMNQMAGYYVREYYPEYSFEFNDDKIRFLKQTEFSSHSFYLRTEFYQYIRTLDIRGHLNYFLDANAFDALKTLFFKSVSLLTANQIQFTRNVLKNIEDLHLQQCRITDEDVTIEQIIAYCPKLKYLNIFKCEMTNAAIQSIFLQYCPSLEHFQYEESPCNEFLRIDELKTFLEKHLKLKHFECTYRFLWANRDLLIETKIQLDLLTIYFDTRVSLTVPFDQFKEFLMRLYEQGIYKTLHLSLDLYVIGISTEDLTNALSTLPALQIMHVSTSSMIDLSRLINLKELGIEYCDTDMEIIAKSLTKLERLIIRQCSVDHILPFIRHTKRLKSIKVNYLGNNVLDLFAMNEERKMLENAEKITISVEERVYLPAQWKSRNLNLSLVKMVREYSGNFV